MAATGDMYVNSELGQQWCDTVNQITEGVEKTMEKVANIIGELGSSDEGGTIGQVLERATIEYLNKFKELVQSFVEAVMKVAEFLGNVVDFVEDLVGTFKKIGNLLGLDF